MNTNDNEIDILLFERLKETIHEFGKEKWFIIQPNVYAISYLNRYILYSPLQGLVALITGAGLSSLLLNESLSISECLSNVLVEEDLETIKFFDTYPKQEPKVPLRKSSEFKPYALMLSPTSACQLACTYCYIRGGDKPRNMPWNIAEAAIQFTINNASTMKVPTYSLTFHGQGEPTANWKIFKDSVSLAEKLCKLHNLKPNFTVASNGILNQEKITFIADHKLNVCLSMDGLRKIMEIQRPLKSRGSSFDIVMKTIKDFEKKGVIYSIRNTVTDLNIEEIDNFIRFIKNTTTCRDLYFEPVFSSGRAVDNKLGGSSIMSRFIKKFLTIREENSKNGVFIGSSTCKIEGLKTSFCGGYGPNITFAVSTEGFVSSCYVVLNKLDPRSNIFIYGKYDKNSKSFKFNKKRLDILLNLNVTRIERCRNCFLKWNCGGGCISKLSYGGIKNIKNGKIMDHCKIDYALIKDELFQTIFKKYKI